MVRPTTVDTGLVLLSFSEYPPEYKVVSLDYGKSRRTSFFERLMFRDRLIIIPKKGVYTPEQLIPWGRPFKVPLYDLEAKGIEEVILNCFHESNPTMGDPKFVLLPPEIHPEFIPGFPLGSEGSYVEDTLSGYRLR